MARAEQTFILYDPHDPFNYLIIKSDSSNEESDVNTLSEDQSRRGIQGTPTLSTPNIKNPIPPTPLPQDARVVAYGFIGDYMLEVLDAFSQEEIGQFDPEVLAVEVARAAYQTIRDLAKSEPREEVKKELDAKFGTEPPPPPPLTFEDLVEAERVERERAVLQGQHPGYPLFEGLAAIVREPPEEGKADRTISFTPDSFLGGPLGPEREITFEPDQPEPLGPAEQFVAEFDRLVTLGVDPGIATRVAADWVRRNVGQG